MPFNPDQNIKINPPSLTKIKKRHPLTVNSPIYKNATPPRFYLLDKLLSIGNVRIETNIKPSLK